MQKDKIWGQVMTPPKIASHMIDILSLTPEQIKSSLFLENSCGNGVFVKELIKRGVPKEHIYACDRDEEISKKVRLLLPKNNFYLGSAYDLPQVFPLKFDFVIGNPPYVRLHNIPREERNYLRKNFTFCKGMFDLYLAFFELGLQMLNDKGALIYITPNSYINSVSGEIMRKYIDGNHLLRYYEDLTSQNIFDEYATYACITCLSRSFNEEITPPWRERENKNLISFTSIQNGLATLADKIFIQDEFSFLELRYVHPIIKASTGEKKSVIIPPKTEEELQKTPRTYEYLLAHKKELETRSLSKGSPWFALGRSQGMRFIEKEKIAISPINPHDKIKYSVVPSGWYVYSGLYATSNNIPLLEEQLKSQELLDYLKQNGKPLSGGFFQISSSLLKQCQKG